MSILMSGKEVSDFILEECKKRLGYCRKIKTLAIVTLGDDEASKIYVRNKINKAESLGLMTMHIRLSENTPSRVLEDTIHALNNLVHVKGIIVQKPLPNHLQGVEDTLDNLIDPHKDVDGFGLDSDHEPCTPKGIMTMLDYYKVPVERKNVLIAGRSKIVAQPLAKMFMDRDCTVTMVHSKTDVETIQKLLDNCDIFVSAIGQPHYWTKECFENCEKKLAVVDVGINRLDGKVVGDVHPNCYEHFEFYTPVPGGVGLTTVATLMENVVDTI